jgi:hypothetical protein
MHIEQLQRELIAGVESNSKRSSPQLVILTPSN